MQYKNKLIFITQLILLIGLIFVYYTVPIEFSKDFITLILIGVAVSTYFFIIKKDTLLQKNYLTATLLFSIGFLIVHFQIYAEYINNNSINVNDKSLVPDYIVAKAAFISLIALVSFYCGYLCRLIRNNTSNYIKCKKYNITNYQVDFLVIMSFIFLILFFGFMDKGYFLNGYGQYMNTENAMSSIAVYAQQYLIIVIISVIILHSWNIKIRIGNRSFFSYLKTYSPAFLFVIAVYFFLVLISGDRDPIISISMALFGGYIFSYNYNVRIGKIMFLGGLAIFSLVFLGYLRATDNNDSLSQRLKNSSLLMESVTEDSGWVFPYTEELATVVRTNHVLTYLAEERGIIYGLGIANNLIGSIPGGGILFSAITGIPQVDLSSSEVATKFIQSNHGMGTTCVGDIYWNTGLPGVIILFFFFGYLLRYIDVYQNQRNNFIIYILWIYIMAVGIGIGRGTFTGIFRNVIFILIFITINSIFSKKINRI